MHHRSQAIDAAPTHAIPFKRINSLPGPSSSHVEKDMSPSDQRPPSLVLDSLPGLRLEASQTHLQDRYQMSDRRTERSFTGKPLSLRTMTNSVSMPEYTFLDRANTDSPSQHAFGTVPQTAYPLLRTDGPTEEATSSSRPERLPSFHQLSKIADGGTEGSETRATGLPSLPTYTGQMAVQSGATSHPQFPLSQQSSPSANFMVLGHPSPTNTRNDGYDVFAPRSPATFSGPRNFHPRRTSPTSARTPAFLPTMTSSSSNDTSVSHQSLQSSAADGYSTTHSTPIESTPSSIDGTPKPPLPRQHSSTSNPSGFVCDYPGCSAPPFQTQYLLNSHANVHSSDRPHYCKVPGCPRGPGGKGFKRKNEAIRHGLVHDSPGYACPFCPLREHKYPRPDNLQRHVRVHHVDKDKDDPLLRKVLAQRPEGGGRGRRRRADPA